MSKWQAKQKGMSLVGLMVALGIGSFMVLAMTQLVAITKNTYKMVNNLNQMHFRAYEIVTYFQRELEKAGLGLNGVSPTNLKPIEYISTSSSRGDVFKVNIASVSGYEVFDYPGVTCLGGKLTSDYNNPGNVQTGYSQFYIKSGTNNLTCQENISASRYEPIANQVVTATTFSEPTKLNETMTDFLFSNIEHMRVLFGENNQVAPNVDRWITPAFTDLSVSPAHIIAARVHFVLRSQDQVLTSSSSNALPMLLYDTFNTGGQITYTPPTTPLDYYLRKVFTITVPFKHYNVEPYKPQCVPVPSGGGTYYLRMSGVRAQPMPSALAAGIQPYTFTPGYIDNSLDRCCLATNLYFNGSTSQSIGSCTTFANFNACDTARYQNSTSCSFYSGLYFPL